MNHYKKNNEGLGPWQREPHRLGTESKVMKDVVDEDARERLPSLRRAERR